MQFAQKVAHWKESSVMEEAPESERYAALGW
jgi:hypothetical protein